MNVHVKMDILVTEDLVQMTMNVLMEVPDVILTLNVLITKEVFDVNVELDSLVMASCVKTAMNVLRVYRRVVYWQHALKNEADINVCVMMSRISTLNHKGSSASKRKQRHNRSSA